MNVKEGRVVEPFQENGYEITKNFLSYEEVELFERELNILKLPQLRGGIRNAEKKFPSIEKFVKSKKMLSTAAMYLDGTPKVARVILFNKTAENNWLVTWHQDKTVAVTKKFEREGWGPWSVKDGTHHVQPPLEVLNNMITLRIHLDKANKENGCLRVVPGSHKLGLLSADEISEHSGQAIECEVDAGDLLIMRPHILHASSKAANPGIRRVIHVEYSGYRLPVGVSWA